MPQCATAKQIKVTIEFKLKWKSKSLDLEPVSTGKVCYVNRFHYCIYTTLFLLFGYYRIPHNKKSTTDQTENESALNNAQIMFQTINNQVLHSAFICANMLKARTSGWRKVRITKQRLSTPPSPHPPIHKVWAESSAGGPSGGSPPRTHIQHLLHWGYSCRRKSDTQMHCDAFA